MPIHSIFTNRVELPSELIYKIISWCPPLGLLGFCLANRACKYEAEKYLYRVLKLSPPTEKCLTILSQDPNKASLVRSFSLFRSSSTSFSEGENNLLCQTLPLMKNLRHLSLWVKEDYSDLLSSAVLKSDFQLLTMCIPRSLRDCAQISSQLSLQSLGFYDGPDEINMDELARYETLVKSSVGQKQSLIFHLTQTHLDTLIIFPVFYQMSSVVNELQNLVSNITDVAQVDTLHIFFHDLSDEFVMHDTFSSISLRFPGVKYLVILIRRLDVHIGSGTMARYLAMLPRLLVLKIRFWDSDISSLHNGVYHGRTSAIAGAWAMGCPELRWVEFPNGQVLVCNWKTRIWDELYSDNE